MGFNLEFKGLNLIFVNPFYFGTSSFPTIDKMKSAVANKSFQYSGFRSRINEGFALLSCYAANVETKIPTFDA
jgi:hypothetical protein